MLLVAGGGGRESAGTAQGRGGCNLLGAAALGSTPREVDLGVNGVEAFRVHGFRLNVLQTLFFFSRIRISGLGLRFRGLWDFLGFVGAT